MFTGIVERTARVSGWRAVTGGRRLLIDSGSRRDPVIWSDAEYGESVAVNGCCLTLVIGGVTAAAGKHGSRGTGIGFDVVAETLRRTTLGDLLPGALVNLERSLRVGDRLGGHYVTGHVDAVGRIETLATKREETTLRVVVEDHRGFRVIPKGSVAVDGVSLTVVDRSVDRFSVALVPHTLAITRFAQAKVGDRVNLEMDPIGKWVEELLEAPMAGLETDAGAQGSA